MRRQLISDLVCPYCNGAFRVSREAQGDAQQMRYGLLRCRCFEFPVVDGILLLSLAKGYGGAEERLQPYVPLQVAAIHYLQRDDVAGLRAWIDRHLPLAAELMRGDVEPYLDFTRRMNACLDEAIGEEMSAYGRFEHLGESFSGRGARALARRVLKPLRNLTASTKAEPAADPLCADLQSYYVSRFFAPRVNALALQLDYLPLDGAVLSLCCGQGVFENLLRARSAATRLVSMDGQFLNLLVTRHFVGELGDMICHDLQFPLPFRDGYFDGVFSSTCLPEIPTQRSFILESVRVTASTGWTFFDQIWSRESPGVHRVNPRRHYRFCQNFFDTVTEYLPLFEECTRGRQLAVDVPDLPAAYLDTHRWIFDPSTARAALEARSDLQMSVLVVDQQAFGGFRTPDRSWLRPAALAVSPVFAAAAHSDRTLTLRRRPGFRWLANFAPSAFSGYPEQRSLTPEHWNTSAGISALYCDSILAALPMNFGDMTIPLSRIAAAGADIEAALRVEAS